MTDEIEISDETVDKFSQLVHAIAKASPDLELLEGDQVEEFIATQKTYLEEHKDEINAKVQEEIVKYMDAAEGATLTLKNPERWLQCIQMNADGGYGQSGTTFAARWAALMEKRIHESEEHAEVTIAAVANECSGLADTDGITGFMYGMAVGILSDCWKYGEQLRRWHNGEYGHDGDGVVNPAILNIASEE